MITLVNATADNLCYTRQVHLSKTTLRKMIMTSELLTGDRYELQLFDLDEDYFTVGKFDNQADAETAISTIPDNLLKDYVGIRIIDWQTESEVIEYLIASNCKVL